jgi:hypothetical protein
MSGSGILNVRPPVRNQAFCLDHQNDVFLNVHNGFFTSRYRREAPIGDCLYKKQLGQFGLKFNILGKKGKFIVIIMVMMEVSVFILHGPGVRHSINEKDSYCLIFGRTRTLTILV